MRRRFVSILIGLVLISDVSRREPGVLVHLFTLPVALLLYPLAGLTIIAIMAAPFVYALSLLLLWRWSRDGALPAWVGNGARWLRGRRPWGYRLRLEKVPDKKKPSAPA